MATLEERLTAIETALPYLATKSDIAELETRLTRWIAGLAIGMCVGLLGLAVSVIVAVIRLTA